jgi:hypothetical protein
LQKGEYRKNGIGTRILKYAEKKPIGEVKDFPKSHRRIYFSKKLTK